MAERGKRFASRAVLTTCFPRHQYSFAQVTNDSLNGSGADHEEKLQ